MKFAIISIPETSEALNGFFPTVFARPPPVIRSIISHFIFQADQFDACVMVWDTGKTTDCLRLRSD